MTIDEIIARLQEVRARHGNLEARVEFTDTTRDEVWTEELDSVEVLTHQDGTITVGFVAWSPEIEDSEDETA